MTWFVPVWHDSIIHVLMTLWTSGMSSKSAWHDLFLRDMPHSYTWLNFFLRDMTQPYIVLMTLGTSDMSSSHESFLRDMLHPCTWRDTTDFWVPQHMHLIAILFFERVGDACQHHTLTTRSLWKGSWHIYYPFWKCHRYEPHIPPTLSLYLLRRSERRNFGPLPPPSSLPLPLPPENKLAMSLMRFWLTYIVVAILCHKSALWGGYDEEAP